MDRLWAVRQAPKRKLAVPICAFSVDITIRNWVAALRRESQGSRVMLARSASLPLQQTATPPFLRGAAGVCTFAPAARSDGQHDDLLSLLLWTARRPLCRSPHRSAGRRGRSRRACGFDAMRWREARKYQPRVHPAPAASRERGMIARAKRRSTTNHPMAMRRHERLSCFGLTA